MLLALASTRAEKVPLCIQIFPLGTGKKQLFFHVLYGEKGEQEDTDFFGRRILSKNLCCLAKQPARAGLTAALHSRAAHGPGRATSGIKTFARGFNSNLLWQRYVYIRAYLTASLRNGTRSNLRGHQILSPAIAGRHAV